MNHWWRDPNAGPAFETLMLAIDSLRDLGEPERRAWAAFFDHYVFGPDARRAADHIAPDVRGALGPTSPARRRHVLSFVAERLRALLNLPLDSGREQVNGSANIRRQTGARETGR